MGIPKENAENHTMAYNPITWSAKYVKVREFSDKTGLSITFVRSLCRGNRIAHLKQGKKKFLIDADRALEDLEQLGQENAVLFSDPRSGNRKSGTGRVLKTQSRNGSKRKCDNQYLENLLKDAVGASA